MADLPDLPRWIDVSGGDDLVLDFGVIIDGHPRLTLPTSTNVGPLDYLPDYLPRDEDGNLVIPDNFCGINVRRASSFQWQKDGETVTDFPYNRVDDVAALPGEHDFLGGIDFTGPIGACAEANEPWQFFQPLTQHGGDSPVPGMRLVIEMGPGSELEFLNFNFHPGEALNAHELFGEDISEKIKAIAEVFEAFELDNGYCSIDNYVQKVCEEEEERRGAGRLLPGRRRLRLALLGQGQGGSRRRAADAAPLSAIPQPVADEPERQPEPVRRDAVPDAARDVRRDLDPGRASAPARPRRGSRTAPSGPGRRAPAAPAAATTISPGSSSGSSSRPEKPTIPANGAAPPEPDLQRHHRALAEADQHRPLRRCLHRHRVEPAVEQPRRPHAACARATASGVPSSQGIGNHW